jgi:plastocyanin
MRSRPFIAVLAVAVSLAAGCSGDGDGAATDGNPTETEVVADSVAPNGETVAVQALDNTFRPQRIEITAGTEVVFTNVGRNEHNVLPTSVAPGEMGDWGVATEDFAPQDVYRHVFTRPGTYAYYCSIHGTAQVGMIGTVVVTD